MASVQICYSLNKMRSSLRLSYMYTHVQLLLRTVTLASVSTGGTELSFRHRICMCSGTYQAAIKK
jgi:ribosomal protein L32